MHDQKQQAFRLSAQQRRLWLAQAEGAPFFAQCAVRIAGEVAREDLRRAFEQAVARHEILRTGFRRQPGRKLPLQVVHSGAEPVWISWDSDPDDLASLFERHRALPLDLETPSPLRLSLLSAVPREHLLLMTLPALCADAWSLANLVDEVAREIVPFPGGEPAEDPVQYVDFSQWQDELLSEDGDEAREARAYWSRLDLSRAELRLPGQRCEVEDAVFAPRSRSLQLPPEQTRQLTRMASRYGVSLKVLLLACWQVLLRRITGREDVLVGTVFAGRKLDDLKGAMGLFASVLPIAGVTGNPPFHRYLELLAEAVSAASERQEHALTDGAGELSDGFLLLPAAFELLDDRRPPVPGTPSFSIVRRDVCLGRFQLKLRGIQTGDELSLELQYDPSRLPAEEAALWQERLHVLVGAVVADPERRVADLEILGAGERRQIVEELNRTFRPFSGELVHRRFEAQAARTPGRTAVRCEDRQLTFADLNGRANRLAHLLRSLGVGPEERVALFCERSEEAIVGLLGALKAGGAYVPLDPSFPADRIAGMLEDSDVAVVVTQAALLDRLPAASPTCICLDRDAGVLLGHSDVDPAGGAAEENLAYVLFTSGSTGRPKSVAVEHRQLRNYLEAVVERIEAPPGASYATVSTLAADLGNTMIFPSLCTGGTLHVITHERASDADALARYCEQHAVDCLKIVPSHLAALLKADRAAALLPRERLVLGGEASSWELIEQVERLAPGCRILNHYGPTETTVGVATHRIERTREQGTERRVPLGRPLANCSLYLLDERSHLVPLGVDGELYVGGRNVARGYLGRPDLTAERFVPDPFSAEPGARLYRTGDVARRIGGDLEFVGRADRQVKIRGFRVEPGEIEALLIRHPAVSEAIVAVHQDGSREKRLLAYLVPGPGKPPAVDELRAFCRERLVEAMVPAAFVILDALPLTANGKVDLAALPGPEQARSATERVFVAPRTAVEQSLAAVWSEVLRRERVGVHHNFFDLGGDSILAIQVIARANQLGLRLHPKHLFEHQTIAALADAAGSAPEVHAEQGPIVGSMPLTPIQAWFFEQGFADAEHWNQSVLFTVDTAIPTWIVERAVLRVVEHHDALRMRFHPTGDGWQQSIADPRETAGPFLRVDLSALPAAAGLPAATAAAAFLQGSLDLTRGPLVRVAVIELGHGRPAWHLIIIHHLVVDGVSWRLILDDFMALCEGLGRGEPVSLPAKTSSFRQWAERLAVHAGSPAVQREIDEWLAALPRTCAPLPVDFAGRNTVASESALTTTLGAPETRALLEEVPAAYRTQINDALLTALVRGYAAWSGQPALLLELEGHGREELFDDIDLTRTVGWFTTHFPVYLSAGADAGPGETLKFVKETLRAVLHRGIGYGLLRYLGPQENARRLRELPEPELKLNYLGQLDRGLTTAAAIRPVLGSAGPSHSPRSLRPRALAVDASIAGAQLRLTWRYSRNLHSEETIESLARHVDRELHALIAHCLARDAGGCTPSDFPLARLAPQQLDRLLAALAVSADAAGQDRQAHRWVEDIYPASPLQKSLLSHLLASPETTVGFEQKSMTLRGELDPEAFERVWQSLVERHHILRTAFVWDELDEPLQVVSRRVALPLERHDWRHLPAPERSARLAAFLQADRERGFTADRPPLMRIALIRLSEESHQFIWSYSHLLLDAWCRTLVLREAFALYRALVRGEEVRPPQSRPYRDYIGWVLRQEPQRAAEFWRGQLAGFTEVTPLRVEWLSPPPAAGQAYASVATALPPAVLNPLQAFARQHKITLNTLVQGGWAVVLSRYSGDQDVVFGSAVSGRPPDLPGVDAMIGMFINNLPVRAQVSGTTQVAAWLQAFQSQLAEIREYEFCSVDQISEWSGIARGRRLFDTFVLFQNYPIDDLPSEELSAGLEVLSYQGRLETNYPLTIVVAPGPRLRLELFYHTQRFEAVTLKRMLQHMEAVLESLAADPRRPLAAVSLLSPAERQQLLVEWSGARLPAAVRRLVPGLDPGSGSGRRLFVLAQGLEPAPIGVPGELCAGGEGPLQDDLLRTGELARFLPGGELELLGRVDHREQIRGYRVQLGVVEAALRRRPAVSEAAVRTWLNEAGDHRLTAYVVADTAALPTAEELKAFVQARLPRYMVPAVFIFLDALARTADGDVDLSALPAPDQAGAHLQEAFAAPRDPVELMLVQVWEEIFGLHPIGIHDDFFELGGYSLLAVQLLVKIPGHFGRRLPLSILLQAGTVAKMADVLRRQVESRPWSPLVELQAGGPRTPLFCVHPLGGEVLCYRDLAVSLGTDQPFFALQARGWEDDLEPHETVEEMAACYLEAMRQAQPAGPYCLAGWSFGGLIALEMAQQILAAGEEVELLAILDTTLQAPPAREKSGRFEKMACFGREHPLLSFSEMWELASREKELASEMEELKRLFRVPAGIDPRTIRRYQRAGESLAKVKERYKPSPYAGRVTLFRARNGHILHLEDPTFGWSGLAAELEIIEVPGSHNDMVHRPHAQELAAKLRLCLDRAGRRGSPGPVAFSSPGHDDRKGEEHAAARNSPPPRPQAPTHRPVDPLAAQSDGLPR